MKCPVCEHTHRMKNLDIKGTQHYWCPNCGTLKKTNGIQEEIELPIQLRLIIAAAQLDEPEIGSGGAAGVGATFMVSQNELDHPMIQMTIRDPYENLKRRR